MNEADWVLALTTVVLAGATIGLVVFSNRLHKATVQLARATEMLGRIEERRDQEEARRMRLNRVKRKLELAEKVVDMSSQEVLDVLAKRSVPVEEAKILRELRHLIDFDTDQVRRVDMDQLLLALDNVRVIRNEDIIGDLRVVFERIQETLSRDFFKWRNEVNA